MVRGVNRMSHFSPACSSQACDGLGLLCDAESLLMAFSSHVQVMTPFNCEQVHYIEADPEFLPLKEKSVDGAH